MKRRHWHDLNKTSNPLGIGCWQIAGAHTIEGKPNGWGAVTEKEALDILITAIESGVDFFDTAQGYNAGKSEELLGKALQQTSAEVIVCTKIVLDDDEINKKRLNTDFYDRVENSLKRLGTQRLDILLIHNPPDNIEWKEFDKSILIELQKKGMIGTFGVSTRGIKAAKNVVEAGFGTVIEWVFNIFERRPADFLFPLLEPNRFNFIARSPLSRGLINPRYLNVQPEFNADDFRSTLPTDWIEWTLGSLKKFNRNGIPEKNIITAAITYCLQHEAVSSAIIGVRTKKQLEEFLKINSSLKHTDHLENKFLEGIPECFPKWV